MRTAHDKGDEFRSQLYKTLMEFFQYIECKLDYFQGLNYILAFLINYFENKENQLIIADYLAEHLIMDFFTDQFANKINIIHY